MKETTTLINSCRNSLQIKNLNVLLVFLFSALLIPYFLVSLYNNPSNDDFDFATKVIYSSFWETQISAYQTWNGRYFATLILSMHPLAFHSFTLYKIIPVILLGLSIHSFYYFISKSFCLEEKKSKIILSLVIVFCFLNDMPTLVQGFYWEPASITYQLANILFLYFIANLFSAPIVENKKKRKQFIFVGFLVLAIIGSNEVSMITTNLVLLSGLAYYFIFEKRIQKSVLVYLFLSVCGTVVLLLSPGTAIRQSHVIQASKHDLLFSITSSFEATIQYASTWLSPTTIFASILFLIICFQTNRVIKAKKALVLFVLTFVFGFLLISATFATGFYSIAEVAPDRAVNVSFWIFTVLWYSSLYFVALATTNWKPALRSKNSFSLILLCTIGFLISIDSMGNSFIVFNDLVTGKAYHYNLEYTARVAKMQAAKENEIVVLEPFTSAPKSLYTEDIKEDYNDWANYQFATYFLKKGVRLNPVKAKSIACTYTLNFDTEEYKTYLNAFAISNEVYFSPPNSSLQNGKESYSVIFERRIKQLNVESIAQIVSIEINAMVYSTVPDTKAMLVICIQDVDNKVLLWSAKDVDKSPQNINTWRKESFSVPMSKKSMLAPDNKIAVYMMNAGEGKVFMDDLTINVY